MAIDNTGDLSQDWWTNNAPPQPGPTSGGGATADQVSALYQSLLGRAPENQDVVNQWIQGTGGNLDAIKAGIAATPEGTAYAKQQAAPTTTTTGPPTGGSLTDPAYAAKLVSYYASQPGADPSLANDPNYWIQKITSGELGTDQGYIVNKMQTAWKSGSGGTTNAPINQTYTPIQSYQPPAAPAYQPISVAPVTLPQMAAPTPVTLPTAADVQATPGYQFTADQAKKFAQQSAIAKGGSLGGGTLQDLETLGGNIASTYYQNAVGNALNLNQANFGNTLATNQYNSGNTLNAYNASNSAALNAASLNLQGTNQQFQNTYQPSWNSYLSNVGQQQFGANYGLSAQNQFWNQGFNENQNAFNQYNTNQTNAFNQWLALANLGNPGNPYG